MVIAASVLVPARLGRVLICRLVTIPPGSLRQAFNKKAELGAARFFPGSRHAPCRLQAWASPRRGGLRTRREHGPVAPLLSRGRDILGVSRERKTW